MHLPEVIYQIFWENKNYLAFYSLLGAQLRLVLFFFPVLDLHSGTGLSLVVEHQLLIVVGSLVGRGLQRAGSVAVAQGLSCPLACGIFSDQDRTCVPCIDRQILNPGSPGRSSLVLNAQDELSAICKPYNPHKTTSR